MTSKIKEIEEGGNIDNPLVKVFHGNLLRHSDSVFKSECPFCQDGLLMVARDGDTLTLLEYDSCIFCGQQVVYLDIDELREKYG